MINTSGISVQFAGRKLFDEVNVKFLPGNCYGLIGANGAGKSTFLKVLSGELEPTSGEVHMSPDASLSMLKQDHFAYEDNKVLDVVILGNEKLYEVMKEKEALYEKADFSEADGVRAGELEEIFTALNGWEAEANAALMLASLGLSEELHSKKMQELSGGEKVKVLLAQALFGEPNILLLDEPTNHLDIYAIRWLEQFLENYNQVAIVVSHDRHFMNRVCSHIADIDYGKIKTYTGNYEFWKQSSELAMRLRAAEKKKSETRSAELKTFIARFSANAAKSKQTTSRKKELESLQLEDLPLSSRKNPFIGFEQEREAGNEILEIDMLSKSIDGVPLLKDIRFTFQKGEKIALVGRDDVARTALFKMIAGEMEPDSGSINVGSTITMGYFPADNSEFFKSKDLSLVDWLRQYSKTQEEDFIRGFLGKMLFSREEANKKTNVLSGGERVRCMLARIMLNKPNLILLDEPTSHLDLESVDALNEGLKNYKGALLFTSHDHELVQTVANRIIDIDVTLRFDKQTTYNDYIEECLVRDGV